MKPIKIDWEAKQAFYFQELEEARTKAVQMEKTMRWWSDCTANWREKWSKVRNERNNAREEVKQLQAKLDYAVKESNTFRQHKQTLENSNEKMRKELERIHYLLLLEHVGAIQKIESPKDSSPNLLNKDLRKFSGKDSGIEEYVLNDTLVNKHILDSSDEFCVSKAMVLEDTLSNISEISSDTSNDELLRHKLSELYLKFNIMNETMIIEKNEKQQLYKTIEKLESELANFRGKHNDLNIAKQEAVIDFLQLKDTRNDILSHIKSDLISEAYFRDTFDKRLIDVRSQIERLQIENASEWDKREKSQTEKLSLERENKKLRAELRDTLDRLDKRIKLQPLSDSEIKSLQLELSDKNKELNDLKQAYSKLKKTTTDKDTELGHSVRRIEQYEGEVKKLRCRIDELKKDLAAAEDEVDANNNHIRKLQRTNEDLQEQVDNLHIQTQYLQNRLQRKLSILKIENPYSDELNDDICNT